MNRSHGQVGEGNTAQVVKDQLTQYPRHHVPLPL